MLTHGKLFVNLCVCMIVFESSMYVCVQVRSCKRSEANPPSVVLKIINHTATLIDVPLLVALPFILGRRILPLHSFGEMWFLYHSNCF